MYLKHNKIVKKHLQNYVLRRTFQNITYQQINYTNTQKAPKNNKAATGVLAAA